MIEITRRVLLVLGVYGALLALLHARPGVVEVRREDFAARQASRPGWTGERALPLEEFIASTTEDRRVGRSSPTWIELAAGTPVGAGGPAPTGRWADRAGSGRSVDSVFLLPEEAPLDDLVPPLSNDRPFLYAHVTGPGEATWLALTWRAGRDADTAPTSLTRPLRRWWPWLLVGALVAYVLLPRRRRGPATLAYSRVRAAILPDVVGLMLGGMFFALVLLVAAALTFDGRLWHAGAWPVYAVGGMFWVLAWAIHGWAAWYAAYRLDLDAEGFTQRTLLTSRRVRFADVAQVQALVRRTPTALRRAMWFAALFSVRALGQALLISSRADPELLLTEKDGRTTRILYTALDGGERLLDALARAGHPVRG